MDDLGLGLDFVTAFTGVEKCFVRFEGVGMLYKLGAKTSARGLFCPARIGEELVVFFNESAGEEF